jgi:hypothetical protein
MEDLAPLDLQAVLVVAVVVQAKTAGQDLGLPAAMAEMEQPLLCLGQACFTLVVAGALVVVHLVVRLPEEALAVAAMETSF